MGLAAARRARALSSWPEQSFREHEQTQRPRQQSEDHDWDCQDRTRPLRPQMVHGARATSKTGHTTHQTASGHDVTLSGTPCHVTGRPRKSESGSDPRKSPQPDLSQPRQSKGAQLTPESKRAQLPPSQEGGSSRVTLAPRSQDPPSPAEEQEGGEEAPQEPMWETPSDFSARPRPSEGREDGSGEGERHPASKEAEAEGGMGGGPGEGQSLKGETYDAYYRSVSSKMLPTARPTNPYKCHKLRQM